jgi:hypothetical protein
MRFGGGAENDPLDTLADRAYNGKQQSKTGGEKPSLPM